jgi:hypothetical protein
MKTFRQALWCALLPSPYARKGKNWTDFGARPTKYGKKLMSFAFT